MIDVRFRQSVVGPTRLPLRFDRGGVVSFVSVSCGHLAIDPPPWAEIISFGAVAVRGVSAASARAGSER